jgi:hypothetical protein
MEIVETTIERAIMIGTVIEIEIGTRNASLAITTKTI